MINRVNINESGASITECQPPKKIIFPSNFEPTFGQKFELRWEGASAGIANNIVGYTVRTITGQETIEEVVVSEESFGKCDVFAPSDQNTIYQYQIKTRGQEIGFDSDFSDPISLQCQVEDLSDPTITTTEPRKENLDFSQPVTIKWNPVKDCLNNAVKEYHLIKRNSSLKEDFIIIPKDQNSYSIKGPAESGVTETWSLQAIGENKNSKEVSFQLSCQVTAPGIPILKSNKESYGYNEKVILSWDKPSDGINNSISGYELSHNGAKQFIRGLSFETQSLSIDGEQIYQIRTMGKGAPYFDSEFSNEFTVETKATAINPQIQLKVKNSDGTFSPIGAESTVDHEATIRIDWSSSKNGINNSIKKLELFDDNSKKIFSTESPLTNTYYETKPSQKEGSLFYRIKVTDSYNQIKTVDSVNFKINATAPKINSFTVRTAEKKPLRFFIESSSGIANSVKGYEIRKNNVAIKTIKTSEKTYECFYDTNSQNNTGSSTFSVVALGTVTGLNSEPLSIEVNFKEPDIQYVAYTSAATIPIQERVGASFTKADVNGISVSEKNDEIQFCCIGGGGGGSSSNGYQGGAGGGAGYMKTSELISLLNKKANDAFAITVGMPAEGAVRAGNTWEQGGHGASSSVTSNKKVLITAGGGVGGITEYKTPKQSSAHSSWSIPYCVAIGGDGSAGGGGGGASGMHNYDSSNTEAFIVGGGGNGLNTTGGSSAHFYISDGLNGGIRHFCGGGGGGYKAGNGNSAKAFAPNLAEPNPQRGGIGINDKSEYYCFGDPASKSYLKAVGGCGGGINTFAQADNNTHLTFSGVSIYGGEMPFTLKGTGYGAGGNGARGPGISGDNGGKGETGAVIVKVVIYQDYTAKGGV